MFRSHIDEADYVDIRRHFALLADEYSAAEYRGYLRGGDSHMAIGTLLRLGDLAKEEVTARRLVEDEFLPELQRLLRDDRVHALLKQLIIDIASSLSRYERLRSPLIEAGLAQEMARLLRRLPDYMHGEEWGMGQLRDSIILCLRLLVPADPGREDLKGIIPKLNESLSIALGEGMYRDKVVDVAKLLNYFSEDEQTLRLLRVPVLAENLTKMLALPLSMLTKMYFAKVLARLHDVPSCRAAMSAAGVEMSVTSMLMDTSDPDIRIQLLNLLVVLAEDNPGVAVTMLESGCMAKICRDLDDYDRDGHSEAARLLAVVAEFPETHGHLLDADLVPRFMAYLSDARPAFASAGVGMVRALSRSASGQRVLLDADVLTHLPGLVSTMPNPDERQMAMRALGRLARGGGGHAVVERSLDVVIAACQEKTGYEQADAIGTMGDFMCCPGAVRIEIVALVIESCRQMLHGDDAYIAFQAVTLLLRLSEDEASQHMCADYMSGVARCLRNEAITDKRTIRQALLVVCNMAQYPEHHELLLNEDILPQVLVSLEDAELRPLAIDILVSLHVSVERLIASDSDVAIRDGFRESAAAARVTLKAHAMGVLERYSDETSDMELEGALGICQTLDDGSLGHWVERLKTPEGGPLLARIHDIAGRRPSADADVSEGAAAAAGGSDGAVGEERAAAGPVETFYFSDAAISQAQRLLDLRVGASCEGADTAASTTAVAAALGRLDASRSLSLSHASAGR